MADIMRAASRLSTIAISIFLFIWAIVPELRTVMAGLMIGTCVSLVNALLLRRRIERIAQLVMDNPSTRRVGLGLGSRIAMVLLAAMVAYRFPEHVNMPAALAACFMVQLVTPLVAIWHYKQENNRKG